MIDFPKNFDDRHWWLLPGIAGALIAVAAVPVKFVPAFMIGLGLLVFGIGQWIDHPLQTRVGHGFKVTGHPWRASVLGVALTVLGVGLFMFGVYSLLAG